jgi:hypothetical protein
MLSFCLDDEDDRRGFADMRVELGRGRQWRTLEAQVSVTGCIVAAKMLHMM